MNILNGITFLINEDKLLTYEEIIKYKQQYNYKCPEFFCYSIPFQKLSHLKKHLLEEC
jgi:hypothetical protein